MSWWRCTLPCRSRQCGTSNATTFALRRGARVLLCDLDTQGHAGKSLGIDVRGLRPTIADLLCDGAQLNDVIRRSPVQGLDVLPANKDLARFPIEVATDVSMMTRAGVSRVSETPGW